MHLKMATGMAMIAVSAMVVVFSNHGAVPPAPVALVIKNTHAPTPAEPVVVKLPDGDFWCADVIGGKAYVVLGKKIKVVTAGKFGFIDMTTGKFAELELPLGLLGYGSVIGGPDGTVILGGTRAAFQYDAAGKLMGRLQLKVPRRVVVAVWNRKTVSSDGLDLHLEPLTLEKGAAPAPGECVVLKVPAHNFCSVHVAGDKAYVFVRSWSDSKFGIIDLNTGKFTELDLPAAMKRAPRCTVFGGPDGTVILSGEPTAFQYDAKGKVMGQIQSKGRVVAIWNGKAVTTGKDVLCLEPLTLKAK